MTSPQTTACPRNTNLQIKKLIDLLEPLLKNPSQGLPEDVFLFVSKISPIVNVDLLIQNKQHHTLLTWRDDGYCAPGWHVPGGIMRVKETIATRIQAVAKTELGTNVTFKKEPLAVEEVIHKSRQVRGHFISLLHECTLLRPPDRGLRYVRGEPKPGQWAWHRQCPHDIIPVHQMYRRFMGRNGAKDHTI